MSRNFLELLERKWNSGALCVGLDINPEKIPRGIAPIIFLKAIVHNTKHFAAAYKPNLGFYLSMGIEGLWLLHDIIVYIRQEASDVPIILDGKFGDIGNTSEQYAKFAFETMQADAVTVSPYMGLDAIQPFLNYKDKGVFVLCRTSNEGASAMQDGTYDNSLPYYQGVADLANRLWNKNGNIGLVVGATVPEQLATVRRTAPELPLLIPGIGKQGGDLEKAVKNGRDADARGLLINVSSGILYPKGNDAYDAAWQTRYGIEAGWIAENYQNEINAHRDAVLE